MKKFIFVTPEGLTFKPSFDSPEPDYLDIQVCGFGESSSVQDALQELMERGNHAAGRQLNQPYSVRIENNSRKSLWLKEPSDKMEIAG